MAGDYTITTRKTWHATRDEIHEEIATWERQSGQRIAWAIDSGAPPSRSEARTLSRADRAVILTFTHPRTGRQVSITADDQQRPVDNLRKLYLILHDLRMIERRGYGQEMASAYLQIEGPDSARRDPYEILGVRPDAPQEIIEAAYRARAKSLHPDVGGDADEFRQLQDAYDRIKDGERGLAAQ